MDLKKPDWFIIKEAEEKGLMAWLTSQSSRNKTPLSEELSNYFRNKLSNFKSSFDEYEGEDVLFNINEYFEENNIDKYRIDFPTSSGTDTHLIPITENLEMKLMVADEYYGGGDYSKYVMVEFFLINENTTIEDVDKLIEFVKEYLEQPK